MKKWLFWAAHSVGALLVGGAMYLLFRQGTYLHTFFRIPTTMLSAAVFPGGYVLRYYLPDFLWTYSLCCALYAVALPRGWGRIGLPLCAAGLGGLWEIGQWIGLVSGTGDVWDMVTYGLAAIVAFYINIRKEGNQ